MGWKPDRQRMKPKAGAKPTAEQERYHKWVRERDCIKCGRPAQIHHVTAKIEGGRIPRSHWLVVPLAPEYHQIQHGPETSVEALGHGGFYEAYGIDLLYEAGRLLALYEALMEDAA